MNTLIFYSFPIDLNAQVKAPILSQKISIEWASGTPSGTIEVLNGNLKKIEIVKGRGKTSKNRFEFTSSGSTRIMLGIDKIKNDPGPGATKVIVRTNKSSFSFFLRDVKNSFPVYIPDYSVVVLSESDNRSYTEVQTDILKLKLRTKLEEIEFEPEESFEMAAKRTINLSVPTWLGISRDFRIFQVSESMPDMPLQASIITPTFSSSPLILSDISEGAISYSYNTGRGISVEINSVRHLEEGVLPILHSTHIDDDIEYYSTSFVSFEKSPLNEQSVKGTHYLVADKYSAGNMFTKEQVEILNPLLKDAFKTPEEIVLYYRSAITNKGNVPRYAWFKTVKPGVSWSHASSHIFEQNTGFSSFSNGSVFCVSRLNGSPLPNEEMAVLLQPGETIFFDFFLPHSPLSNERALELSKQSFEEKFIECKSFWNSKLQKAAEIRLPEKRIEEMIRAGLLHLDLVTYGNEPDGTLAPDIGVYSPIGTESSPIIQFYASMGWNDIAKRSLTYFLEKQHEDGFIQNFNNYMGETGAALWSMGEYFRYTNDKEWVKQIEPKLLKSCNFLLRWREENKVDSLRGKGFGMISGKVADPEDSFHQFMLNGYAYLGLIRVSEMLTEINPAQSEYLRKEAEAWKEDIRESFFNSMALSPTVPLGDGRWVPTVPPWTEATGLRALYNIREAFYSHGTVGVSDAMLGPMYLVFCEVIDVNEPAARMMLDYHSELFYQNNAAFSQPYYSRHNWVQAQMGLVKPFLKTYYNTFSALADRETYTFWEHLYRVSPHKTHEEAWFLMETRWMLYIEEGQTLKLLNTIPRDWMEDGKIIELNRVQSYFGPFNLKVTSQIDKGYIEATIQSTTGRKPENITIRLPHPEGKKAVRVSGGEYNPDTETVTIKSFNGNSTVRIDF